MSTVTRVTCDRLFAGTTGLAWGRGEGHTAREGEGGGVPWGGPRDAATRDHIWAGAVAAD